MNKYVKSDHTLKDTEIVETLKNAVDQYENGELAEVRCELQVIIEAIDYFDEKYTI